MAVMPSPATTDVIPVSFRHVVLVSAEEYHVLEYHVLFFGWVTHRRSSVIGPEQLQGSLPPTRPRETRPPAPAVGTAQRRATWHASSRCLVCICTGRGESAALQAGVQIEVALALLLL